MLDGDRVTSVFLLLPSPAFALPPEPATNGFLQTFNARSILLDDQADVFDVDLIIVRCMSFFRAREHHFRCSVFSHAKQAIVEHRLLRINIFRECP